MTETINIPFWQIFTAVMFANFVTIMWLWGFYRLNKADAEDDLHRLHWTNFAYVIVPMLFTGAALYLAVS